MKCNFSQGGYCHRIKGAIRCDGDSDRSGCPGWKLIEALRQIVDALKLAPPEVQ